jgi:general stress protein YciG
MAGTVTGGKAAAATNKQLHGADFYNKIGGMGGKAKHPNKGFGSNRELAKTAGKKGGQVSRRSRASEYL